jgi:2,4-dienoyl-CoA reductase-like NADH-dependent reductase (Old Yellow Enzyme family)
LLDLIQSLKLSLQQITLQRKNMRTLLQPLALGEIQLKNRLIMSPLTRARATGPKETEDGRTPNELMLEYYVQRATAGMIITEATSVTPQGVGYANTPGIWSEVQVAGWKKITTAVHAAGGKIVLQLWHVGRISHSSFLNGELPVSASAIAAKGHVSLLRPQVEYETPRALELSELKGVVEAYRKGAANAKLAGFDGVEIHGANGYLLDQFLQDSSNQRTDAYGGSIENRARLMLEVADAVISVWGAGRVGMHLAPRADGFSMGDSNLLATFSHVATELGKRKLAFLCAREYQSDNSIGPQLKKLFKGAYIANEKFTLETADAIVSRGDADAVAFGVLFIANPDLVRRYQLEAPLNAPVPATFYVQGSAGYTDYPFLKD